MVESLVSAASHISETQRGSARSRQLLVRWKGYGAEHDQWQSRAELMRTAPELVADYDARQRDILPAQLGFGPPKTVK